MNQRESCLAIKLVVVVINLTFVLSRNNFKKKKSFSVGELSLQGSRKTRDSIRRLLLWSGGGKRERERIPLFFYCNHHHFLQFNGVRL